MRIKLDIPLLLSDIAKSVHALRDFNENDTVLAVCTDSRECQKNDLFFALSGEYSSGEDYVIEAVKNGAFAVSAKQSAPSVLMVKNTVMALLNLAKFYQSKLINLKATVGITGSVGKTTLKEILLSVLSEQYQVCASAGNLNNTIGVPLSVLSAKRDTEILLLEIGMNHRGEISEIVDKIHLDYAVITNIGSAHIGNLGSISEIAKAKMEIATGEPVFYQNNEPLLTSVFHGIPVNSETDSETSQSDVNRALPFVFALCEVFDMGENQVLSILKRKPIFTRKIEHRFQNLTVIDDSYNASPEAVKSGLLSFSEREGKKGVILGDMQELGTYTEKLHEDVGLYLSTLKIDYAVFLGVFAQYYKSGALLGGFSPSKIKMILDFNDTKSGAEFLYQKLGGEGAVYLKASHKINLSRAISDFEKLNCKKEKRYG